MSDCECPGPLKVKLLAHVAVGDCIRMQNEEVGPDEKVTRVIVLLRCSLKPWPDGSVVELCQGHKFRLQVVSSVGDVQESFNP